MKTGTLLRAKRNLSVWTHAKLSSHAQTHILKNKIVIFLGKHGNTEYAIFYSGKIVYDGENINNEYDKIC